MAPCRLEIVETRQQNDPTENVYRATVQLGHDTREVWYRLPCGFEGNCQDALLVASLLPAMVRQARLCLPDPVSSRLFCNIDHLQEIFHTWNPKVFKRVSVEARTAPTVPATTLRGVGCFFTGGVDSFYTLLKHMHDITHIIYIWGYDIRRDNPVLRPPITRMLHEVAAYYHKELVEVETNLREDDLAAVYANTYSGLYSLYSTGAALASVGTLLASQLRTIYIPSGQTYADLVPWGSHLITDPLWSSEAVEFVHDGAEATRLEKIGQLAEAQAPLRWLRVCFENRGLEYNCGKCEKCLRTMSALQAVGALEHCTTFREPLRRWRVMLMSPGVPCLRTYSHESLEALQENGRDPALAWALRLSIANCFGWGPWRWGRRFAKPIRRWIYERLPANCRHPGG